jgi:hypothetical protein
MQAEELVTITDPRDPLYGQTFKLHFIENKQHRGKCCIVQFRNDVTRHIPLQVTDRAPEPIDIYPIPLDLTSVRQLQTTFAQIVCQKVIGTEDGTLASCSQPASCGTPARSSHPCAGCVDAANGCATAKSLPSDGTDLSPAPNKAGRGGEE